MSLIDAFSEAFVMLVQTDTDDNYGGFGSTFTEGDEFQAASVLDSSVQAKTAAVQGVTALYTITTSRSVNLKFHDVIKRKSDGKIFRITSDGDDKKTPATTLLDMRQVSAEEWELPGEEVTDDEQG